MRFHIYGFLKKFAFFRYIYRYLHRRMPRFLDIKPGILNHYSSMSKDAFFVQIGVNDGEQQDPFQKIVDASSWRGVMVEPVQYVYKRLLANKRHLIDRVRFANIAIAKESGVAEFWHLQEDPALAKELKLYDALGSFRKEVVLSHKFLIPDIEERLIKTDITALSFDDFCKEYDISDIEVLQIDTEGYDFEILKEIDFNKIKPKVLIYEHLHLNRDDKIACKNMLEDFGYRYYEDTMDALCLNFNNIDKGRFGLWLRWFWLSKTRNLIGGLVN